MPQHQHFAVIGGELVQSVGQQDTLFAPGRLLAGGRNVGHQAAVEQDGGAIKGIFDFAFEADIAPLGAEVAAEQVGQVGGQDLP